MSHNEIVCRVCACVAPRSRPARSPENSVYHYCGHPVYLLLALTLSYLILVRGGKTAGHHLPEVTVGAFDIDAVWGACTAERRTCARKADADGRQNSPCRSGVSGGTRWSS